jgi:aminoglycoside phosphotransferase (APT) family kinase protein
MHDGEVPIDAGLVKQLVATQFPDLASLAVRPIRSTGTVNAIYRLGDDLCVRLPRLNDWADTGDRELSWLPRLAPHLTLHVPEPVERGEPGCGYPFGWAIYRWIDGVTLTEHPALDQRQLAADLARFVLALRAVDPTGPPAAGRRPLAELDDVTRAAIDACPDAIDRAAATAAWDRALESPPWDGERTWIHNDLLPTNLLVDPTTERLTAVIDFGSSGAGDPPPTWCQPGACSATPDEAPTAKRSTSTAAPGTGPVATPCTKPC